jgi:hypothetical protein
MIRYALPAAVAALVSATPALVQAQTAVGQPMQLNTTSTTMTTNASAPGTIVGQPQPGPADYMAGYPAPGPYVQPMDMAPQAGMQPGIMPVPPGAVWIPGHYNWDPSAGNYVWLEGQFALAPRPGAQWLPGHWQQTPTSWIWVDGRWS